MIYFRWTSNIAAPVERVFAFHARPDAVERLLPPWQRIKVVRREGGLEVGAVVEFDLLLGPMRIRWVARHILYEPNKLFADEQERGPFSFWVHRHEFGPEAGGTKLTDVIRCSLPGGAVADALFGWAIRWQLRRMFDYRHRTTRAACTKG